MDSTPGAGNRLGVVVFLLVVVSLTCLGFLYDPGESDASGVIVLPALLSPTIGAILARVISRQGFGDFGWRPRLRRAWPYYAVAVAYAPLGGWLGASYIEALGIPLFPFTAGLSVGGVFGALLAATFEEIGWRDYLQLRLFPSRRYSSAVGVGVVWSAWHAPSWSAAPGFPDTTTLVLFTVGTILLSVLFGWMRERSLTFWTVVLAHAAWNVMVLSGFAVASRSLSPALLVGAFLGLGAICLGVVGTSEVISARSSPALLRRRGTRIAIGVGILILVAVATGRQLRACERWNDELRADIDAVETDAPDFLERVQEIRQERSSSQPIGCIEYY